MRAILCFVAASFYALWVLQWRFREGNLWTDCDGLQWNGRAWAILVLALAGVLVSIVGLYGRG